MWACRTDSKTLLEALEKLVLKRAGHQLKLILIRQQVKINFDEATRSRRVGRIYLSCLSVSRDGTPFLQEALAVAEVVGIT